MPEDEIAEIYGTNLEVRAVEALQQITSSRKALERRFRQLLGIQIDADATEPDTTSEGGLMWIPQPGVIDPPKWPPERKKQGKREKKRT